MKKKKRKKSHEKKREKYRSNVDKLKNTKKVNSVVESFTCIVCEQKITDPRTNCYMGNKDHRHKSCGPGSRIWAVKFPSWESFTLYLDAVNAMDFFNQYLKEKGYTDDRFFRIKNAPQNFLIHLKKHLKTSTVKKGTAMVKANKKSRISKSGKYKNIRHLLETMFARNKDITKEELDKTVKKEYPDSAFLKTGPSNTHFNWYRAHIVIKGEFTQIPAPPWTKNIDKSAKKKKSKKDKVVEKVKTLTRKFKKEDKLKKKKHVDIDDDEEQENKERAKKVGLPSKLKLKKKNPLLNKVGPTDEELAEIENGDDDLKG